MRKELANAFVFHVCRERSSDRSKVHVHRLHLAAMSFLASVFTLGFFNAASAEDLSPNENRHARRLPGMVLLTTEQRNAIGITTASVESTTVTPALRLLGHVAADETHVVRINAGTDGFIHDVSPMVVGSLVQKDQWLASFTAPDLVPPTQSLLVTLDTLDRARANQPENEVNGPIGPQAGVEQAVARLLNLGMSPLQVESIKQQRDIPTVYNIVAPISGVILSREIGIGQKFERGSEWYRIANLDHLWVFANILQSDLDFVRPGMTAQLMLPKSDFVAQARIADSTPQPDTASGMFRIRLELDNPGGALKPGMAIHVNLPLSVRPSLAIPASAVLETGMEKLVFVERANGLFEARPVQTGWRYGDRVEITKGLSAGDVVILSSAFLLDSESNISSLRSAAITTDNETQKQPEDHSQHMMHGHGH